MTEHEVKEFEEGKLMWGSKTLESILHENETTSSTNISTDRRSTPPEERRRQFVNFTGEEFPAVAETSKQGKYPVLRYPIPETPAKDIAQEGQTTPGSHREGNGSVQSSVGPTQGFPSHRDHQHLL
ncbi:hypothetical protein GCK32_017143 [Trichostrongylus colubriformis]|uniref:Uncharacterized protein n=1 Tax=Trichostrongylus colubriformis TaxID=6319 RepID=A0AAN8EW25_TRICO